MSAICHLYTNEYGVTPFVSQCTEDCLLLLIFGFGCYLSVCVYSWLILLGCLRCRHDLSYMSVCILVMVSYVILIYEVYMHAIYGVIYEAALFECVYECEGLCHVPL